jgi:hypothetical protein
VKASESIVNLAPAMVSAQAEIAAASKDGKNPAFKSRYATLTAAVDASRPALAKYGLCVLQFPTTLDHAVSVVTRLLHKSGEWIEEELTLPVAKFDPQGVGSAITYARRYGYCALVGVVADEDDDGNAASKPAPLTSELPPPKVEAPKGFAPWFAALEGKAEEGLAALKAAWTSAKPEFREHIVKHEAAAWGALKAKAELADAAVKP